jgi:flagellar hook-length control protein FliK
VHSTLLASPQSSGAGPSGDSQAHGEHHSAAYPAPSETTASSSQGGSVHDTLWVPDPTLQTPAEASASGTTGAATEASSAAYVPAADPALASDLGSLPDLGSLDLGGGLAQTVETLNATIELAARQGISQARIALHPAELGAIRIHLSQTAEGLLARVTADTPAAAQALATGHAELRQSLGQLGLASVRLHIAQGGPAAQSEGGADAGSREAGRRAGAHGRELGPPSPASARRAGAVTAAGVVEAGAQAEATPPTHSGRALDVLA